MVLCPSSVLNRRRPYADEEHLFARPGCSVCEAAFEYQPRHPEESILYRVVAESLESFLARQQERGRVVPRFVEKDLRAFLDCGIIGARFCARSLRRMRQGSRRPIFLQIQVFLSIMWRSAHG